MQNKLCKIEVTLLQNYEEALSTFFIEKGISGLEIIDSETPGSTIKKNFISLVSYVDNDDCSVFYESLSNFLNKLIPENSDHDYVLSATEVENKNWENEWKKNFDIQHIADLTIVPSWQTYNKHHSTEIVFYIDPGMAFGTGLHETTRLCIEDLFELHEEHQKFNKILDLGCGTGILAMLSEKLFEPKVIHAVDNDPLAVETAQKVIMRNNSESKISVSEKINENKYDLIIANINADTLITLFPIIEKLINKNGFLLLSGILDYKEKEILQTYNVFESIKRKSKNEWIMLRMSKIF